MSTGAPTCGALFLGVIMRLNAKKAKELRRAGGYKNQTLTPGVTPFPGIHHLAEFPLVKTRTTIKRSSAIINGEWSVVETPLATATGRRFAKGMFAAELILEQHYPVIDKETGERSRTAVWRQVTQPTPITKPAKLYTTQPKGIYRSLKNLHRKNVLTVFGDFIDNGIEADHV